MNSESVEYSHRYLLVPLSLLFRLRKHNSRVPKLLGVLLVWEDVVVAGIVLRIKVSALGATQLLVGLIGDSLDTQLASAVVLFDNPPLSVENWKSFEVIVLWINQVFLIDFDEVRLDSDRHQNSGGCRNQHESSSRKPSARSELL
jgi:hypothetical protein